MQVLTAREGAVVAAIGEAFFPQRGPIGVDAAAAGVVSYVDNYLARLGPAQRLQMRALLMLFEVGTAVQRRGRLFSAAAAVNIDMHRRGVVVHVPGQGVNAIKLLPPLVLDDDDVGWLLSALEEVLASYRRPTSGPIAGMAGGLARHAAHRARATLGARRSALGGDGDAGGSPRVREHSDYDGPLALKCDVCVVGSGPAGTVLAHGLATAGLDVVVLEAGAVVRQRDMGADAGEMLARWFWDGGLRTTWGNVLIPTMQARCLGGGSVFHSAICMRAPDSAFRRWADEDGVEGLAPEVMARHYTAVERFMGVRPTRPEVQGRRNELFGAGAQALGFQAEPIPRNEDGCRGSGECMTGCRNGAKLSVDRRGVPELLGAGGRVYTSVHVDRLWRRGGRVRGVRGAVVDPVTRRRTHSVSVEARCTVLAAGATASPLILQRSGHRRAAVGGNLRMHPGTMVVGSFGEDVEPWHGAAMGYHVTGFVEEGIKLESMWATPSIFGLLHRGVGTELARSLANFRHMATWEVWVSGDDSVGRVRGLPGGASSMRYQVGAGDVARMQEGMARLVEMFFAAGARSVALPGVHGMPSRYDDVGAADAIRAAHLCARDIGTVANHVFGTTAMGGDARRHVTGSVGAVYGLDDVHVCDTGIFPSSPMANPMLTAMALADRQAEVLAERYGR